MAATLWSFLDGQEMSSSFGEDKLNGFPEIKPLISSFVKLKEDINS